LYSFFNFSNTPRSRSRLLFFSAEDKYAALTSEQLVFDRLDSAAAAAEDDEDFGFGDLHRSEVRRTIERSSNYIDPEKLTQEAELGEGQFGKVYKGWLRRKGKTLAVAIKTVKSPDDKQASETLVEEAELMMQLKSNYLVSCLGICARDCVAIVTEFISEGKRTGRRGI
jgi:hypothetical protein